MQMFLDLVLYCIIPLIAGYLTKTYFPKVTKALNPHIDLISILIIALMIAGPVGENAEYFLHTPIAKLLTIVGVLFVAAFIFQ